MTTREYSNPVTFYLDDATHGWLASDCTELHLSRSAYLRIMVEWWRGEREAGRIEGTTPERAGESGAETSGDLAVAMERVRELEAQVQTREELSGQLRDAEARVLALEGDLRTMEAEKDGMREIINMQRERQGMSDSLNQDLTQTLNRVTLMLPAAGEGSDSRGFNWRFWRRSE